MGEPRNRFVRSNPQRSQLLSAVLSGGAVAAVAVAFAVAGVDDVEVLATVFFAPVFVAALLGGRNVGYAAAAAAALGYLALRFGDIGDSGALRVAVLVAARSVCYAVVAQATPSFQHRFRGIPAPASFAGERRGGDADGDRSEVDVQSHAAVADGAAAWNDGPAGHQWVDPAPVSVGAVADEPEPVPVGAGWMDPAPAEVGWGPPGNEAGMAGLDAAPGWDTPLPEPPWAEPEAPPGWEPPALAPTAWDEPGSDWGRPAGEVASAMPEAPQAWAPAAPGPGWGAPEAEPAWNVSQAGPAWDEPPSAPPAFPPAPDRAAVPANPWDAPVEPAPDPWADPPAASPARDRSLAPPAPTVPTGWVDDATVPLGDETIPLGYTGELFLPRELRQQHLDPPAASRNGSSNGGPHPPPFDPLATPGAHDLGATDQGRYGESGGDTVGSGPFGGEMPSSTVGGAPPVTSGPMAAPASPPSTHPDAVPGVPPPPQGGFELGAAAPVSGGVDPETRLWNARFFRERLTTARDESRQTGLPFSVVMIQVSDHPFQALPYRRQVALLRELGHQFIQARMIDHLVHLPDGAQHWFAVVLPDADRGQAHQLERRLRSAIASYLRSRGLQLGEVQSASLTSPDDDQAMGSIWASLLGPTGVR